MGQKQTLNSALQVLRGVLPAAGLYAAGVLTLAYWRGFSVPCGESAGCELVAKSAIAAPGGIPIALVGVVAYLFLLVCGFVSFGASRSSRIFQSLGYAVAAVGAVVSVGLTLYSVRVIGATCRWCLASTMVFCLTLIVYAISASWDGAASRLLRTGARLLIVCVTLLTVEAIFFTENAIEYAAPIVNTRVLTVMAKEDLTPKRSPVLGDAKADYTVVFFGDLQCRTCKEALPLIAKEIQATPHTRLVYRYFPLRIHDYAKEAAIAAEGAKKTVGFWPFVWKLYSDPHYLNEIYLRDVERWARLDGNVVDGVYQDPGAEQVVDNDHALGQRLGIKETPTIIIVQGNTMKAVSYKKALEDIRVFGKSTSALKR